MVHLGIDFDPRKYQPEMLVYYYHTTDIERFHPEMPEWELPRREGRIPDLRPHPCIHRNWHPKGKYAVTIYTIAPDKLNKGSWENRRRN